MAYTFLNAINNALDRVGMIQGDNAKLTALTDSGRQSDIDIMMQVWNEQFAEMYSLTGTPQPTFYAESTITLVNGTREYALAAGFERMRWPLIDQTNGRYIYEWPGGYEDMRRIELVPSKWIGLAVYAAINPATNLLRLGWIPQSTENGLVYNYGFDARISLVLATDTFPFSDSVVDALLPAVCEMWKKSRKGADSFDAASYAQGVGRAGRLVSHKEVRRGY